MPLHLFNLKIISMPLPLLASAGIMAAASEGMSLLNNGISSSQSKKAAALNDKYQRALIYDSPSLQKAGLQKAGISVASLNGGFSAPSSSANVTAPSTPAAPDAAASVSAAMSLQTQDKQNQLLDEQIERQKLENDEIKDRQNAYRKSATSYWMDDDGHRVYTTDTDANSRADAFSKRHNGEPPELIVPSGHLSQQAYNAEADVAMARNNYYGNLLAGEVSRMKLGDKDVINALAHLDKQSYDNLVQTGKNLLQDWKVKDNQIKIGNIDVDIRKIDKDIREKEKLIKGVEYALLDLRYNTEKETNIRPLVTKLLNNGLDMNTIGKLLVAVLLKQFNM